MKILKRIFLGCLLASVGIVAFAQSEVVTNTATELRAAPDDTAVVIRRLSVRTPVQSLERRGAWTRVKSGDDTGWVRMMDLRGGATVVVDEKSSSGGWLAGFNRLLSGGSSRGNQRAQSATVKIRGFSREDVEKAEFNPAEFEKLKRFQSTDGAARQLASQGKLQFRSVAYLSQDAIEGTNVKGARK